MGNYFQKNGEYTYSYRNGNKKLVEHYAEDKLHGDRLSFYENGNVRIKETYSRGNLVLKVTYYPDGTVNSEAGENIPSIV